MPPTRLLDTTTLELVRSNHDGRFPPYAILSHTWDRDEITFDQIQGNVSELQKSKKIRGACTQAERDGWKYIWIDSLSIDKSSSAELSEAINSMYDWYSKAEICYIYLSDVGPGGKSLSDCRWLSRSWTLQELIAPQDFRVFDQSWQLLGTKATLQTQLSRLTGIDGAVFEGTSSLYDFSIGTRMSWAAHRKATRPEDIAYSLLGLFGINMPLLYGEGEENAFLRLQKEILNTSGDQSIFAYDFSPTTIIGSDLKDKDTFLRAPLIAVSPDQFRNCNRLESIIQYESAIQNGSLELEMPISVRLGNVHAALLACRYRSRDETSFVAILLEPPEHRTNKWSRRRVALGVSTAIVPTTMFFSIRMRTISLEPPQRHEHRARQFWCPDEEYLRIIVDEREFDLLPTRPEHRLGPVDDKFKWVPDKCQTIFRVKAQQREPIATLFSIDLRRNADLSLLTVSVRKSRAPAFLKTECEWVLYARTGDAMTEQTLANWWTSYSMGENEILRENLYHHTGGVAAWCYLARGPDLVTVAVLSKERWLQKGFWTLKVADFEKSADGWQNRHNLFPHPTRSSEPDTLESIRRSIPARRLGDEDLQQRLDELRG
jgi:hypothetical protein